MVARLRAIGHLAAVPIVLALPAGRMTDRLGYKIPILAGTCGICVALLMAWWWPALTTLYFTATLLGISFMAFQIATQTLVGRWLTTTLATGSAM